MGIFKNHLTTFITNSEIQTVHYGMVLEVEQFKDFVSDVNVQIILQL